ncbi:MAG: 6-phosphogluconolactonase [Nanoarchaeota archaeon]
MKTHIDTDRERLEQTAASLIADHIRSLAELQDMVIFAVPGGRSVSGIFELLAKEDLPWEKVHLFMIDERLVPPDDPESNYRLVEEQFIRPCGKIPQKNIHPFIMDDAKDDKGVSEYGELLKSHGSRFDIIILSAGENGHVGALHPNHHSIKDDAPFFIIMDDSPKPPKGRMSSSKTLLEKAKVGFLLFFGESKREALHDFRNPGLTVMECPSKIITQIEQGYVITDIA